MRMFCHKRGRGWCKLSHSCTAMGSGASVQRSASSMRAEIEKLRKRELDLQVNEHNQWRVATCIATPGCFRT